MDANISELLNVVAFLHHRLQTPGDGSVEVGILDPYNLLLRALKDGGSIKVLKSQILEKIDIELNDHLTLKEIDLLHRRTSMQLFGSEAAEKFKSLFSENNHDLESLIAALEALRQNYSLSLKESLILQPLLEGICGKHSELNKLGIQVPTLQIIFRENVNISNMVDFDKQTKAWAQILRGISFLLDENTEDYELITVKRGSLIIDLAVNFDVAEVLNALTGLTLSLMRYNSGARKSLANSEHIELVPDFDEAGYLKNLGEGIKKRLKAGLAEIIERFKRSDSELDGEEENNFTLAQRWLEDFLLKGGLIDFILPKKSGVNNEIDKKIDAIKEDLKAIKQSTAKLADLMQYLPKPKIEEEVENLKE